MKYKREITRSQARAALLKPQTDAIFAGAGSRTEKMRRMRAAGATLQSIGDYFGITREGVRKIIDPRRVDRTTKIGTLIKVWNKLTPRSRAAFFAAIKSRTPRDVTGDVINISIADGPGGRRALNGLLFHLRPYRARGDVSNIEVVRR